MMTYIMVDIEADGPIPGDYSMVCFGAIVVEPSLEQDVLRQAQADLRPLAAGGPAGQRLQPRTRRWSSTTRRTVMQQFADWVRSKSAVHGRCSSPTTTASTGSSSTGISTISWARIPSAIVRTNLGSLYKGVVKDMFATFKHLRKTRHTHNPVDDARGNAEALLQIKDQLGLKISPGGIQLH